MKNVKLKLICFSVFSFFILAVSFTASAGLIARTIPAQTVSPFKPPVSLQCAYRVNPLGIDTLNPDLSWILQANNTTDRGLSQTAYQILVASAPEILNSDKGDLWDTRKYLSDHTSGITYAGKQLRSGQQVFWKVRVWDQNNNVSAWSAINQWVMGVLNHGDWAGASWITAPPTLDSAVNSTFLLRHTFVLKPGLKRAVISICGLGQYEMTINGNKPTETLLNPGWTEYSKTCLYDTYDITALLNNRQNAIGILLSNGMYRVKKGGRYAKFERTWGRLQAIAKIQFEYNDGTIATMVTDGTWRAGHSPMTFSSIYGGEDWDARKVENNWDKANFNESAWLPVELSNGPGGQLKGITHAAPPLRAFQTYKPISSTVVKPNVTIYDLGQQASFISSITATGLAGSVIKITPSELLQADGTLFHNNYNGRAYSQFTLSGAGDEHYMAKFFTTGCRYYQVECIPAAGGTEVPLLTSIAGLVVHSDNPPAGEFSCSDELFNRIYKMIGWAEVSNMKSVISDCPHRERLGWLEQDHLHGPSFRYNYDMRPLVGKIISDMHDTQQDNGLIPCIAPELTRFGADWREAIEWGSSGVLLPWQQYQWTGDVAVLKQNYPMMKAYVEFLTSKANNGIAAVGKGDWEGRKTSPNTPKELVSTAFYFGNADILAKSAKLIENAEELAKQQKLAESIKVAFNKKFFNNNTKQYGTGSQCANAMALVMGLVDTVNRQDVLNNLVKDLYDRNYENTTGEVGWRYVLNALADGGRSDIIYKINNQTTQPGYGYQLKMGATALPETWDAFRDNSQNQFMLGHIIEWFYHNLAGIQMDPEKPGFKNFIINPNIVGDLTGVKGSYNAVQGKIISEWKRAGKNITLHIVVPPNTTATIYVPAISAAAVKESGKAITQVQGVKLKHADKLIAVYNVVSGVYNFTSIIP